MLQKTKSKRKSVLGTDPFKEYFASKPMEPTNSGNARMSTPGEKRSTSVHLSVELLGKAETLACWQRRTLSDVVENALNDYLDDKKMAPIPPKANDDKYDGKK